MILEGHENGSFGFEKVGDVEPEPEECMDIVGEVGEVRVA